MGLIGGRLGYELLRAISPQGATAERYCNGSAYVGKSKFEALVGQGALESFCGKTVLDFGCGAGETCLELARAGASHVVGLDIQDHLLCEARRAAKAAGLESRCTFVTEFSDKVDAIVSLDAFEHFADPSSILRHMRKMLVDSGRVWAAFGPTWYHPLGGHLFSVFPWAHLVFTERAFIQWRADFKEDGATSFAEVAGGLNGMTIRRWERTVAASDFEFERFELRPIRRLSFLHNRVTRELFSACVIAVLKPAAR